MTVIILALLISLSITFLAFRETPQSRLDMVDVNDISQTLAEQWDHLKTIDLPGSKYHMDYIVADNKGKMLRATRRGLNETINSAIQNRDTIVDITRSNQVLGKLIIYNNTNRLWKKYHDSQFGFFVVMVIFLSLLCISYALYLNRRVFRPFCKLQVFAQNVAQGKLDIPLEMDQDNLFGAFTESFDIMREELAKARENERLANQSKKELVASLSHDIKTPVASIEAVSEIMIIKSDNEETKRQLGVIYSKADQINTLITNMFNATLEELQELSVTITEFSSLELNNMIKNSDYNCRVNLSLIPECIVLADKLRLMQVIDNIISNSYKYAGTSISFSASINSKYLEIKFKDYGSGVEAEEIPLLFNKFYQARNAKGKSGTGLGLYISKFLIKKMSGDIDCKNEEDGFAVAIRILIA
ncbi:sensor histidine kinase [Clostridium oryzae]|nr:HAMP domain-containing sensor histidine kinase [Clostridium oryzae]